MLQRLSKRSTGTETRFLPKIFGLETRQQRRNRVSFLVPGSRSDQTARLVCWVNTAIYTSLQFCG
jgi:hypothetical protein